MKRFILTAAISSLLKSWVNDEIDETECLRFLISRGLNTDEADYIMDMIGCKSIKSINIDIEQAIIDDLDQSYEFDDDIDSFKTELAEKLGIEYDAADNDNPYGDYLRYESGVYA